MPAGLLCGRPAQLHAAGKASTCCSSRPTTLPAIRVTAARPHPQQLHPRPRTSLIKTAAAQPQTHASSGNTAVDARPSSDSSSIETAPVASATTNTTASTSAETAGTIATPPPQTSNPSPSPDTPTGAPSSPTNQQQQHDGHATGHQNTTSHAPTPSDQPQGQQQQPFQFNWHKAWYPVAVMEQLDASKPCAAQLLGMDLVLWRDAAGQWRAFQDCCPHRLAPLSEGRIDDKTGNLYCNYHGWQFDGAGSCTNIPQQPAGAPPPNPKRSCVVSYPTQVCEQLLWVWGDASPGAAAEAAATPLPALAPEVAEFGDGGFWSTKLFMAGNTNLGRWYQRFCNASYTTVKENVFNDPSHDVVLHHGLGGLSRDLAKPGEVKEFTMDERGYSIKRLNVATGRTVSDTCVFPCSVRRDFAGDPRAGAGVGYVTPTTKGKCNMIIGIVQHPDFAAKMKPKGLKGWLTGLLPPTPEWMNHIVMHDVVDADIVMQHGVDVNSARAEGLGYMPAKGMDQGPIAFRKWLQKYGGGGPDVATLAGSSSTAEDPQLSSISSLPRRQLLDRFSSHTAHCKHCSAALTAFTALQSLAAKLSTVLAAAALGVSVVAAVAAAAAVQGTGFWGGTSGTGTVVLSPAVQGFGGFGGLVGAVGLGFPKGLVVGVVLLWLGAGAAEAVAGWAGRMVQRFIFVDYDEHTVSKK